MKNQNPRNPGDSIPQTRKEALMKLLVDEDEDVYSAIRETLLKLGRTNVSWMNAYALSDDPILRTRVREIIDDLSLREADELFLVYCLNRRSSLDLERGLFLLAGTGFPNVCVEAYQAQFDEFVRPLSDLAGSVEERLAALHQTFLGKLGFRAVFESVLSTELIYLNHVVDNRTGHSMVLSFLLILFARRLGIELELLSFDHGIHWCADGESSKILFKFEGEGIVSGRESYDPKKVMKNRQMLALNCSALLRACKGTDQETVRRVLYYRAALADCLPGMSMF